MPEHKIKLKITTPERVILEDEVDQITIPTQTGEITILPNHIPLITNLVPGVAEAKKNGEEITMAISGGFLEYHDNELIVLADFAERAEEIDLEEAQAARQRAEEMKQNFQKTQENTDYAVIASQVETHLARIKATERFRRRTKGGIHLNH